MKFLLTVASCLLAVTSAKPGLVAGPAAYSAVLPTSGFSYSFSNHYAAPLPAVGPLAYSAGVPVAYTTGGLPLVSHPAVVAPIALEKTQYHAQDEHGQAVYGHSEAYQTHNAVQDAAGNKIGSYSYVAPDGQVIAANYVADGLGYRVASNAVPVDAPEVIAARAAHLHEVEVVKHRSRRSPGFASYPYGYSTTLGYHSAGHPVVARVGLAAHVAAAPHALAYRYY